MYYEKFQDKLDNTQTKTTDNSEDKKEKLSNLVVKLSSLSLGVYLIHGIYLDITKKLFDYDTVHSLIGIPIYSIIVFIVSVMTINILKKIKFVKEIV